MKFPNNYRFITEPFCAVWRLRVNRRFWVAFVSALALFGLGFAAAEWYMVSSNKQAIDRERQAVLAEITSWENRASQYSGYRDAYFTLAVLYYRLREREKAKENLEKAFQIDPNFEKGRKLELKMKIEE